MMLSVTLVKRVAVSVGGKGPQAFAARAFTLSDTLSGKKKVEEERFIREQEKKFFEKKKAELDSKQHEQELSEYKQLVAPCMADIHEILEKTKDKISDKGLEAVAKYKLGLK